MYGRIQRYHHCAERPVETFRVLRAPARGELYKRWYCTRYCLSRFRLHRTGASRCCRKDRKGRPSGTKRLGGSPCHPCRDGRRLAHSAATADSASVGELKHSSEAKQESVGQISRDSI